MQKFESSRLSVAMRRRGFTQTLLAEECNVTKQYISMIERSEVSPPSELIEKFAQELDFPQTFFYAAAVEPIPINSPSFRAQRKMTSTIRDIGLGSGDIAASIITADLDKKFKLPAIDIPDLSAFASQPEEAADILRARWDLGYEPINQMVQLLESKGVRVYWLNADSPSLDAICFWKEGHPFVMLNSYKDAGDRGRFDAAHELGHLVLHQHDTSNLDNKEVETAANRFASAFLLPRASFQLECPSTPDFGQLYQLKVKWRVAIQAMIYRGHNLGIFSDWQKQQAFQRLQVSGERKREKVHIPREDSMLHWKIFKRLAQKGITPEMYANTLNLSLSDLKDLMPTAHMFLSTEDTKIISLDLARKQRNVMSGTKR